jgi:hypothetical protein
VLGLAVLFSALACAAPDSTSSEAGLGIAPSSPEVAPGDSVQFTAAATGVRVAWAVLEPNGGTIDGAGLYTAPATEGLYTVTATSTAESGETQVRVKRSIRVAVSPSSATVTAGATLALTATVTGGVGGVSWSVTEGTTGGTVSSAGVYTAPSSGGVYHVVATSTADPTKTGTAAVTVTAPPPPPPPAVSIAVSPLTASVAAGGTVQFSATVSGSTNTSALWSVVEPGGGSVSGTGLYTAPATAGTYHVEATSSADASKQSSAAVTVTAPPPPSSGVGAGTSYTPSSVTNVTGGGPMPSWTTNVVNAADYGAKGDGSTDDTVALQNALNAGHAQGKPVVIPATSAFYKITSRLLVYGSVGGINGMPTIQVPSGAGTATTSVLALAPGMSGWVYNLHLVGYYAGEAPYTAVGEWAMGINVGGVNGVTIKGNLIENVMGDSISTDGASWDGGTGPVNVLVDGNSLVNPYRCAVAFCSSVQDRQWVIMNNFIDKRNAFVSALDFEPEGGTITNVEFAYNKFSMAHNLTGGKYGSDGKAASAWQNANSPNPGANLYLHNNYGTFGLGWWMSPISYKGGNGDWTNIVQSQNVEGASPP